MAEMKDQKECSMWLLLSSEPMVLILPVIVMVVMEVNSLMKKKTEGRMCSLWLVVWGRSLHGREAWWQDHMEAAGHIVSVARKSREACFLLFI